jgi:flagellar basal body-associated protein FliL
MSDIDFSDAGGGSDGPEKPVAEKRRGGGFPILRILMIAGIVLGAVLLMFTVSWLTLAVAGGRGKDQTVVPASEEYQDVIPIYDYSSNIPELRLRTIDSPPASVAVKILIGFDKGNKEVSNELTERRAQIQDFLRGYFSAKKAEDLSAANERRIKEELRERLNDLLKAKGVRDILFEKFDVVTQ